MDPVSRAREKVLSDLKHGGVLDQRLPGYEERPAQIQMAEAVATALANGQHILIEASTGTGKTLAYLLPIVRSGKVALVSTANKALQEQLFYKDIPFIAENVRRVNAALVKGMNNYLCLRRLEEANEEAQAEAGALFRTRRVPALDRLNDLCDDPRSDGDLDVVPFTLPGDLRRSVAADGDDCAWNACPFFGKCYVKKMRENAQRAQVIVVNHTLLLLDVISDGGVLPDRDVVVIDEAHHLEEEATRAFTVTVSPRRVRSVLMPRGKIAQQCLRDYCDQRKLETALEQNDETWLQLMQRIRLDYRGRAPLAQPFEEGLQLSSAIAEVSASLNQNKPDLDLMEEQEKQIYGKLCASVKTLADALRFVFSVEDVEKNVYYVERESTAGNGPSGRGRDERFAVSASAAPLDVTKVLQEKLFDRMSVIATSATMAINNSFDYYRKRVGVTDATELVLPLAFDYRTHALLYVPRLKYEPVFGDGNGPYLKELAGEMAQLVRASRGRAFLLFTSQKALRAVLAMLEADLMGEGFTVLAQGPDLGRAELLRRFRTAPMAVLFGLRSFWEGVDVAGEALSLVAIDKLPFDPPDDPVHEARVSRMRAAGENWFGDFVLPQAILRLKQGVGRLLRTKEDRGVLAILDTRLRNKGYGRLVINALPPARRTERIEDVQEFFNEGESNR